MKALLRSGSMIAFTGLLAAGCSGSGNPAALADLEPSAEFQVRTDRVETFEEVEVHVTVTEDGVPMAMRTVRMEIEPAAGGLPRVVEMEPEEGGYSAHVMFFEPGEHHLRLRGTPELHRLSMELGEMEVTVHRRHVLVGPYWVELELSPAPVLQNTTGHVHLMVFDVADGSAGSPVEGLDVGMELHAAGGEESLEVTDEGDGEYEAEAFYGAAGVYELHVEIAVDGSVAAEEFHIPVLSLDDEGGDDTGSGDGEGDGHGH